MGRLLIDTDPTLGSAWSDVDDVLAIELVARRGRLAGLTSVYGNGPLPVTHALAADLGRRFGVPVARGARSPDDPGHQAVEALVAHRGPVLALGPLTNVARALQAGARWSRLTVLGGTTRRLPNLRPLHTTELNIALDPAAASVVLSHGASGTVPTDVVLMEPCRQVWAGEAELRGLPSWLAEGCRPWLQTALLRHPLALGRGFHPWDVLGAIAALAGDGPSPLTWVHGRLLPLGTPGRAGHVRLLRGQGPMRVAVAADADGVRSAWLGPGAADVG